MQNHLTAFRPFAFAVNRNAVVMAEGSHALLRPRKTFCGPYIKAVENGRRQQPRKITNQRFGRSICLPSMVPRAVFRHFKCRVVAAFPMQLEPKLTKFHGDDNLLQHCTQNPLPRCRRTC